MYDGGKIIVGLIIGIGLLLFPVFYNAGKAAKIPEPELTTRAKEAKECVEPKLFMRTSHMKLVEAWRNEVVREANRVYKSSNGKTYDKSLQNTCMDCHSNKVKFCDQCHDYMGVAPFCWDCHIEPKENK
ncbi:MAG: sulfate reduction electron transfer complex DsrMKJOP subunit DsrJ [Thermodesulfobacteriota bacterium]|nr:sulfate reduction electron transfer complex DsrMKJOP subunit DsrJ [Thermodesulfobacteriota bacterium]